MTNCSQDHSSNFSRFNFNYWICHILGLYICHPNYSLYNNNELIIKL